MMDYLEMPDDLTRPGLERDHGVRVRVRPEPLAAVEIRARTAGGKEEEASFGVDGHHRPHVRSARAAPAVARPGRTRGIRLARGDRVPAPSERAASRIVRAHDAALDVDGAIVADRGADDDEPAHDGRRRRHLVTAAPIADVDALGEVDLSVAPK